MTQQTKRISLDRAVLAKYQIDVFPGEFGDAVPLPEGSTELPTIVVKCFVGDILKEVQTERRYLTRGG